MKTFSTFVFLLLFFAGALRAAPPSIVWESAPATADNHQTIPIAARGEDADGNLTEVRILLEGVPFVATGGGDGFRQVSARDTAGVWPEVLNFTAQAFDAAGEVSAIISHRVTINAPPRPPNDPPQVTWFAPPAAVASDAPYRISVSGSDPEHRPYTMRLWKDGVLVKEELLDGTAYGWIDFDARDTGPRVITYTAEAVDEWLARSALITHTVTVAAPIPPNPLTIEWTLHPDVVEDQERYRIGVRARDADGKLTTVTVWKSGYAFMESLSGDLSVRELEEETYDYGPGAVVFLAYAFNADGARSAFSTHTVWVRPRPSSVGGGGGGGGSLNRAPEIFWTSPPLRAADNELYYVSARASDLDGDLGDVVILKEGAPFASERASGAAGATGGETSDVGPVTIEFSAYAVDLAGHRSPTITHRVAIGDAAAGQFQLITTAGLGGSVSPGGLFPAGTTVSVSATASPGYAFAEWSGDAGGISNPLPVLMNADKTVQATFALQSYALTTSATAGGTVSPGGVYPHGSLVTVTATPDASGRWQGWAGDASGTAPSVVVLMDAPKFVQAVFQPKTGQTILFNPIPNQPVGGAPFALVATASSGLPVEFIVVSGAATISGNALTVDDAGEITVRASQPGNAEFLPAPSVTRTLNGVATATTKYRTPSRTIQHRTEGHPPYVIEVP